MPYFCQYPSSVDVNCFDSTLKELVFFSTAILGGYLLWILLSFLL